MSEKPFLELKLFATAVMTRVPLRRDDTGDYALLGKFGRVYASGVDNREFTLVIGAEMEQPISRRRWDSIKSSLAFARLTQDGDEDGVFLLDRLPAPNEALAIRATLGLKKQIDLSEEARKARILRLKTARKNSPQAQIEPAR